MKVKKKQRYNSHAYVNTEHIHSLSTKQIASEFQLFVYLFKCTLKCTHIMLIEFNVLNQCAVQIYQRCQEILWKSCEKK